MLKGVITSRFLFRVWDWEERRTRKGRRSMNNRRVVTLEGY